MFEDGDTLSRVPLELVFPNPFGEQYRAEYERIVEEQGTVVLPWYRHPDGDYWAAQVARLYVVNHIASGTRYLKVCTMEYGHAILLPVSCLEAYDTLLDVMRGETPLPVMHIKADGKISFYSGVRKPTTTNTPS